MIRCSPGTVNLLGKRREVDELDGEAAWYRLRGPLDAADVVPRPEGLGPGGAVLGCRHAVAGQEEEVVDLVVGGEKPLGPSGRLRVSTLSGHRYTVRGAKVRAHLTH